MRLTPPVWEISGDMELVDREPSLNNLPITTTVKTVKAGRSEFGDARPGLARDNRLGIIRHSSPVDRDANRRRAEENSRWGGQEQYQRTCRESGGC